MLEPSHCYHCHTVKSGVTLDVSALAVVHNGMSMLEYGCIYALIAACNVEHVLICANITLMVSHYQLVCHNKFCCENVHCMHVECFFIHILQHQTPCCLAVSSHALQGHLMGLMHLTKCALSLTAGAIFIPSATPATPPDVWLPGPRPGPAAAALDGPPLPFPSPSGTALAYWIRVRV